MTLIREILVPTDFRGGLDAGLTYARSLAETYGARLHILHVIEEPVWNYLGGTPPPEAVHEEADENAHDRLQNLLSDADRSRFRAELVVGHGRPVNEIVEYAARQHIDLIVMSTHGDHSVGQMLSGSVSEKLVREAPCPVLTVPYTAA